jgi:uncharacterized flavoprotein (TIGR03862 family)
VKSRNKICIIGGGPAGLMAAEVLSQSDQASRLDIHVFDAMPTVGRKFLLAGIGGLNLTHSEESVAFARRYGTAQTQIEPMLDSFGAAQIRDWAAGLGIETFVGTSGRVFPKDMKAAPLLRAWLARLRGAGVQFHMRHKWIGWNDQNDKSDKSDPHELGFDSPDGAVNVTSDAVILALGGASWPKLGSTGAWAEQLQNKGVAIAPMLPANCGFDVQINGIDGWSEHFASRFAGHPLKTVAIDGKRGEFVITASGVEGSLIYALSSQWRDQITSDGLTIFYLDLLPDFSLERVLKEILHPRGSKSLSSHLKSRLGLDGVKMGLLFELLTKDQMSDAYQLAKAAKALPVRLARARPIAEAISTAGGVRFNAMSAHLELKGLSNVYCAGEMLDWEAPTGGYLLTACLASGRAAAQGVLKTLGE